jgi:hypothetical protein
MVWSAMKCWSKDTQRRDTLKVEARMVGRLMLNLFLKKEADNVYLSGLE